MELIILYGMDRLRTGYVGCVGRGDRKLTMSCGIGSYGALLAEFNLQVPPSGARGSLLLAY